MSVFIYTMITVIVILIIISAIFRKRTYKEVDRLEDWKNEIANRPIPDEIGKVKQLQMSGQTEEKFEEWRDEWDDIVGMIIPNIGEQLFDIEDLAAKNRFKKAKLLIETVTQRLNGIEDQLSRMSAEIQRLVESEEQNRSEIDEVREEFKILSTELTKRRGALGQGLASFDERVDKISEWLKQFDEATLEGSYLKARDYLLEASTLLQETKHLLERYPKLLVLIESTIPSEIEGLQEGMQEMEDSGYVLEPFDLTSRIDLFKEELVELKNEVTALECDKAEERLEELSNQIEQLYETLEYEVESKQYVSTELPQLSKQVEQVDDQIHTLLTETIQVQQSYHIPGELQKAQSRMRDTALDLTRQLAVFHDVSQNGKQTFTSIREMIEDWKKNISRLEEEVRKDKESLYTLREEEWQAKETLRKLRDQLLETKRTIQQSNIPGLPEHSINQLEQAEKKLQEAATQLEQIPLELGRVAVLVGEAKEAVERNEELIHQTIELAEKAERVIQIGNLYRNRSETTQLGLAQAEQYFRQCDYEAAFDCAVEVIKVYEPHILDRVSEYSNV